MRVGVVGVGHFGRLHAAALRDLPGARLAALCEPDEARRHAAAVAFPDVPLFASFAEALERAEVDAVVLATPETEHAAQAVAAMERGWDVLVEKPLAPSLLEARAVREAARRTGRVVHVGTVLRFSVPHRQLAGAVHAGRLGAVLHVRAIRWISREWLTRTSVHPAYRAAIHDIDQVLWLTRSRVVRVAAAAHPLPEDGRPAALAALLWLRSGATASVETHFLLPAAFPSTMLPPERSGTRRGLLEVVGSRGLGRVDEGAGLELWTDEGAYAPDTVVVPAVGGRIDGALRAELEHFTACVAGRRAPSTAALDEHVHAVAVAAALVAAAETGSLTEVEEGR